MKPNISTWPFDERASSHEQPDESPCAAFEEGTEVLAPLDAPPEPPLPPCATELLVTLEPPLLAPPGPLPPV